MTRPVYSFRPNLKNPEHQKAWEKFQCVPEGQKNQYLVQAILEKEDRKWMEEIIQKTIKESVRELNTVPKLVKRTGLSRGFFYKNETVRKEMDRVLEQQAGMIDPKRYIGDIVMKNRIELLEQQVRELKREKEQLEKENIRLQKALNKKDLNLLKNL